MTECHLVPIWCPNDVYQGGACVEHVAGHMCLAHEDCENQLVMLPDWGGPCVEAK